MDDKLRIEISNDIEKCNSQTMCEGSEILYRKLIAKYTTVYPNFEAGVSKNRMAKAPNKESDYREQIFYVKEKLQMMLATDNDMSVSNSIQDVNGSKGVFIVHGHDKEAKVTVANFLEKLGLKPIILHEQINEGETIIEKIETFTTSVRYAVILYTECDIARSKGENKEERYRARQNVVFEHGYFIGRLGRNKVSVLVKGNVETPGDVSGIVYIKMDDYGAWKIDLAKNIKAAGLDADMNKMV